MKTTEESNNDQISITDDTVLAACSSDKDRKVARKMIDTLKGVGGNDLMLQTAFITWGRLRHTINHLPSNTQWEIVYESTMIAYDARIAAFDHMIEYKPKIELPENGS